MMKKGPITKTGKMILESIAKTGIKKEEYMYDMTSSYPVRLLESFKRRRPLRKETI